MSTRHERFRLQDVSEIIIGSAMLAFPVAITEEVWNLDTELSAVSALAILVISLLVLAGSLLTVFTNRI